MDRENDNAESKAAYPCTAGALLPLAVATHNRYADGMLPAVVPSGPGPGKWQIAGTPQLADCGQCGHAWAGRRVGRFSGGRNAAVEILNADPPVVDRVTLSQVGRALSRRLK